MSCCCRRCRRCRDCNPRRAEPGSEINGYIAIALMAYNVFAVTNNAVVKTASYLKRRKTEKARTGKRERPEWQRDILEAAKARRAHNARCDEDQ